MVGLRTPECTHESGMGLPPSTTSRKEWHAELRASVVECGSPMPLCWYSEPNEQLCGMLFCNENGSRCYPHGAKRSPHLAEFYRDARCLRGSDRQRPGTRRRSLTLR